MNQPRQPIELVAHKYGLVYTESSPLRWRFFVGGVPLLLLVAVWCPLEYGLGLDNILKKGGRISWQLLRFR